MFGDTRRDQRGVPFVILDCSEFWLFSEAAGERNKPHIHKRSSATEACQKPNVLGSRVNTTDRLRRLRLRMKASGYDAYVIPSIDEHQSKIMTDHDKRREFISGFTGSSGTAVVLSESAALWTDGRYFIQAEQELDCNWILMKRYEPGVPEPDDWIIRTLGAGGRVGVDPKLLPYNVWMTLKEKLTHEGLYLMEDSSNLIDDIWNIPQGRAPESISHVFIHDIKYAGQPWEEKVNKLKQVLKDKAANGTVVTALDEIAWLFNLRGNDIADTPLFKAYSFISSNQIRLYIKPLKLTPEVEKHLCPNLNNYSECVQLEDYVNAFEDMKKVMPESGKILISSSSSYAVANLVPEENRIINVEPSPVALMKVIKNPVEIKGMKNAALKDSVAIVDFIALLEQQVQQGKHWDEIKAAKVLAQFRKEQEGFQGESFTTISAVGPNGAVIHYRPQIISNRNINMKDLFLLDSGGQYLDGTTDVTRTFHFGTPTEFEVATYTRVLMGAIDLITAVFSEKIKDVDLDILARLPLFQIGLDYLHGTGHGIGHFLGVHEGPVSISKAGNGKGYALKPGMFLSDEPGYYEKGKFGIRLETMMMVIKAHVPHAFNDMKFYTFEPVSFVPFEPKLIDLNLLSVKQKEFLNRFNVKARNTVGIELQKQGRERGLRWLLSRTEHIPVNDCRNHSPGGIEPCHFMILCLVASLVFW
ncbi:xaa-Pro aminopeptidase ApepP-like isoform X4 [Argiope bruennichi]|uniref:xaa-Pro aminopeptidase ApepP-like isoform X4 n=1 Tax=Argiope bruennichi TaxID=94029 RepID=UPI0024959D73|nr:xaa-Pro aminopeptidase ApepP-like isoform X4 [Argiope bruennichi]